MQKVEHVVCILHQISSILSQGVVHLNFIIVKHIMLLKGSQSLYKEVQAIGMPCSVSESAINHPLFHGWQQTPIHIYFQKVYTQMYWTLHCDTGVLNKLSLHTMFVLCTSQVMPEIKPDFYSGATDTKHLKMFHLINTFAASPLFAFPNKSWHLIK